MDGNLRVKRILSFLSGLALVLLGPIGRMPAWAQLLTLGIGGVVASAILTPPTLVPQLSAAFDSNIANGYSANGLKVNGGGAAGSMEMPATITNSWFETFEGTTDALNSGATANPEYVAPNLGFLPTSNIMLVTSQIGYDGQTYNWWRGISGVYPGVGAIPIMGANGSGYNQSVYPWTAIGGGCARPPSGIWWPQAASTIAVTDPGANCATAPSIAAASIPGVGAEQALATGATSCVSNSPVAGEMTVTTTVAIAHGVYPAQTFALSGFSGAGNTGYNATYTALAGATGTTLVGETTTGGGTCPANSPDTSGGFALSGTGASISLPQFSSTNPWGANGGTGIIAKNNDHFCAVLGEYGADSPTPGIQFIHFVDQNGAAYPGAPSVPAIPNQGAVSFNGFIVAGTQDTSFAITASFGTGGVPSTTMTVTVAAGNPLLVGQTILGPSVAPGTTIVSQSSGTTGGPGSYVLSTSNVMASGAFTAHSYAPALTVTSMNSVPITGASWSSANNGTVTFTAAANWVLPGTVFTVSGASPSGYNGTYIAGVGTNGTGTTISAVSWPVATLANPGTYVSGASFVGTLEPGMYVPGVSTSSGNAQQVISPYGTFGSTGAGGAGTYGLTVATEGSFNITASITGTVLNVTTSGAGSYDQLIPGDTFTTAGGVSSGTQIVAQTSGTAGSTGNYTVNNSQSVSSQTLTLSGNVWSSATPGILYAGSAFYSTVTPSYTSAWLGQSVLHTQSAQADVTTVIGTKTSVLGTIGQGAWGGELANIGMHWGVFPQDSSGNPSTTSLSSLCTKTTDYQAFDAANSIATNSLYRLNDPGEWGDSSYATITGYLSGASGTSGGTATLNVSSTIFGSLALASSHTAFLAGPGLPPSPTPASVNPASIPLTTSASSTYTVTFPTGVTSINLGSSGSPVQFSVGKWKPAAPLGTAFVNGYITTSGGSGACASSPCLNVTSVQTGAGTLGATFTGTFNPALTANNLTVSGITGTLQSGMLITDGGVNLSALQPLLLETASCTATCSAYGGYYPSTIGPESMVATLSTISPGQMINGPGVNTPVQVIGYGSGTSLPAAGATYVLSNSTNGAVGSSGSPVAFTLSSVSGGGAPAPGPALTIDDAGAGTMFAVTNFPSSSPTGAINLHGTYSAGSLGGTPSSIQAQLSTVAGGPAVAGFSWTALSSQSIAGGNWSGSIANVPPGNYWVSVRAANGTSYATMRNFVSVGAPMEYQGEGNPGAYFAPNEGGAQNTIITAGVNSAILYSGGYSPDVYGPFIGPFASGNKYRLAYTQAIPANRLTQQSSGLPLAEGPTAFAQAFWNASGIGPGTIELVYAGVSSLVTELGAQTQNQTLGVGNGSTTAFCSAAIYCNITATGLGATGSGALAFNAANLTGATITGYVTTAAGVSTLHVSTLVAGALAPGLVLAGSGVTGSPTVTACASSCVYSIEAGAGTTWTLSTNQGTIGSSGSPVALNLAPSAGAPWPNSYVQSFGYPMVAPAGVGYGNQIMKFGSFTLSVNGTQVCADTATFSYTAQTGQCSGAGIASSFINYATGDYDIVFSSPPAANAIIQASWTNIITHNSTNANEQVDVVGDGTATSGGWSAAFAHYPGGAAAHVYAGCVQDYSQLLTQGNYALGAIGLSQQVSWFYNVKLPGVVGGHQAGVPLLGLGMWRYQGPMMQSSIYNGYLFCDQWFRDFSTPSTFTGTVTGGGTSSPVLTLNSAVTGSLWEGEVLGCNPYSTACSGMGGTTTKIALGTQIVSLLSGTWGANGSTYSLTSPSGPTGVVNVSSQAMTNEIDYTGGPAYDIGPESDVSTQVSAASGIGGVDGHPWSGPFGGRRIGARAGILAAAVLTNNPSLASEPTLSRTAIAACDAAALAAPCFDIGNTYAASATTTSISGAVLTFNGLSAHARPIVDGQAVSCSGCNTGLYVVSVSNPPTQSTTAGAGQIGSANNGMTVTLNSAPGVSGAVAFTFGCSGVSGTGSNCIDFSFSINTGGSYGTTASLATCGVNNLMGSATIYTPPAGNCKDSGIGSWVNSFRIGATQAMWTGAGNPYFDGVDAFAGTASQSAAFTCNIVAATVVQCVKAPVYTSGVPSSIGEWLSSGTWTSYGDSTMSTGRLGGLIGPAGGQSLGFTAGSGYTNGTYVLTAGSCGQSTTFTAPKIDVTISGGAVVDVYPSAQATASSNTGLGITSNACTFPIKFTFTASLGGVGNQTLTVTGTPGGVLGIGTTITDGGVHLTTPVTITALISGTGGAGTYTVTNTNGAVSSETMTAGSPGGSGGAVSTLTYGPNQGAGGIASMISDANTVGAFLYDNSGESGNPLFSVFANPANSNTSYFEPGLPVKSWGQSIGARVSG